MCILLFYSWSFFCICRTENSTLLEEWLDLKLAFQFKKKKLLSKHKALTEEIQQTSFHKCWAPECLRRFAIVAVSLTLKRVMILKFMWKRLLNPAAAQQVTDFDDFDYS